jgi:hypothetical protein
MVCAERPSGDDRTAKCHPQAFIPSHASSRTCHSGSSLGSNAAGKQPVSHRMKEGPHAPANRAVQRFGYKRPVWLLGDQQQHCKPDPASLHPLRRRYAPPRDEVRRVSHDRFRGIADLSKVGRLDQRMLARTNVPSQRKETWRGRLGARLLTQNGRPPYQNPALHKS